MNGLMIKSYSMVPYSMIPCLKVLFTDLIHSAHHLSDSHSFNFPILHALLHCASYALIYGPIWLSHFGSSLQLAIRRGLASGKQLAIKTGCTEQGLLLFLKVVHYLPCIVGIWELYEEMIMMIKLGI